MPEASHPFVASVPAESARWPVELERPPRDELALRLTPLALLAALGLLAIDPMLGIVVPFVAVGLVAALLFWRDPPRARAWLSLEDGALVLRDEAGAQRLHAPLAESACELVPLMERHVGRVGIAFCIRHLSGSLSLACEGSDLEARGAGAPIERGDARITGEALAALVGAREVARRLGPTSDEIWMASVDASVPLRVLARLGAALITGGLALGLLWWRWPADLTHGEPPAVLFGACALVPVALASWRSIRDRPAHARLTLDDARGARLSSGDGRAQQVRFVAGAPRSFLDPETGRAGESIGVEIDGAPARLGCLAPRQPESRASDDPRIDDADLASLRGTDEGLAPRLRIGAHDWPRVRARASG